MKRTIKQLLGMLLTGLAILCYSCEKSLDIYQNDPRINFYERTNDQYLRWITSKAFSFAPLPSSMLQDTILIRVMIMGAPATEDRSFTAIALPEGTQATEGVDYEILYGTIPANETIGYLPVVLYRTEAIKTESRQLLLQIADAGDFKPGVGEENTFTLSWNDSLIKPANWDTLPGLKTYFGDYSNVKYQFIIDVLGTGDFNLQTGAYQPGQITHYQMLDYKAVLKDALTAYNGSHPVPLTDEFGTIVTFP